jgi:hypothetical protein
MKEIWKPIPWLRLNHYSVSNLGRVKSNRKLLKPLANVNGYHRVNLYSKPTEFKKSVFIHRLVLEAFEGPMPANMVCCHKDGQRANNKLPNLRYDTHKNNEADKTKHGTSCIGEKHGSAKLTDKDAAYIRKAYKRLSHKNSNARCLAEKFGVSKSTIEKIVNGRYWREALAKAEGRSE